MRTLKLALFLALLPFPATSTEGKKTPLYIGCILPLSGGYWSDIGNESQLWAEAAIDHVNNNTDILADYELHLICNDSQGDIGVTLATVKSQVFEPPQPKIMIFGGILSTATIPMSRVLALWHLIQVSPLATAPTLSNRVEFPYFFRTHPSQFVYNSARLAICRSFGWTKVATLYQNHEKFSVAMQSFHENLVQLNMTLLTSESFDVNPAEQLARVKESDARIIAGAFYLDRAMNVFCEAYKLGMYGSKYVWMVPSRWLKQGWWENTAGTQCTVTELVTAIDGMIGIDMNAWDDTDMETISGRTSSELRSQLNTLYESYGSLSYDAIWSIAVALNSTIERFAKGDAGYNGDGTPKELQSFSYTQKNMVDIMSEELYALSFHGMSGPVSFDRNGERQGIIKIEQNYGGHYRTIGFYNSKTGLIDWKISVKDIFFKSGGYIPIDFPLTIQNSRTITISSPVFIVMTALSVSGLVLGVCLLVFNVYNSDKRVIKMSSPNLNNAIILGCCMMYACVIVDGLDLSIHPIVCKINKWLLAMGFSLSYGTMFSKTWRVYKIFTNKTPKKMSIKDQQLFALVGLLLSVDAVILFLWLLVNPPNVSAHIFRVEREASFENEDITIESEEIIFRCYSDHNMEWSFAIFAYKGLLLLFGAFLTFQTRNVKIEALNDSRYVALSVYNVVVFSFICLPVSIVLHDKPQESYAIVSSFLIFCTTTTMLLLFGPKIFMMYRSRVLVLDMQLQGQRTDLPVTNNASKQPTLCVNCHRLNREVHELKKRLAGSVVNEDE